MNEYWRLWNIPIHSFLTRHVYFPLLRRGYSKGAALMVVFLFSALGHEYWASVPLLHFTGYTTLFFALQAPLMIAQKKLDKVNLMKRNLF
jgi:diacylglycerol O-acyltransferase-1